MAEAIIGGLLASQVCRPDVIWAADPLAVRCDRLKSRFGVRVGPDNRQAVSWADVIVLAVKPQVLPVVMKEIGEGLDQTLFISIVAGVTIRTISEQAR